MNIARDGDRLRVENAEPQIWIGKDVLDHLSHPDVELIGPSHTPGCATVLTVNAVNGRFVYCIDCNREHPTDPNLIYAEWPD